MVAASQKPCFRPVISEAQGGQTLPSVAAAAQTDELPQHPRRLETFQFSLQSPFPALIPMKASQAGRRAAVAGGRRRRDCLALFSKQAQPLKQSLNERRTSPRPLAAVAAVSMKESRLGWWL